MSEKVVFSHTGGKEVSAIVVETQEGERFGFRDRNEEEESHETELAFDSVERLPEEETVNDD